MCLLRLFDDADAHDQERIETLPLLRLHEGPEAWLEELQVQVGAGRRDREVCRRQDTPRWPRRGARRRGGGTSQDPIRTRTGGTCGRTGRACERAGVLERSHPRCRSQDQARLIQVQSRSSNWPTGTKAFGGPNIDMRSSAQSDRRCRPRR
jgi:hypothetical protein